MPGFMFPGIIKWRDMKQRGISVTYKWFQDANSHHSMKRYGSDSDQLPKMVLHHTHDKLRLLALCNHTF